MSCVNYWATQTNIPRFPAKGDVNRRRFSGYCKTRRRKRQDVHFNQKFWRSVTSLLSVMTQISHPKIASGDRDELSTIFDWKWWNFWQIGCHRSKRLIDGNGGVSGNFPDWKLDLSSLNFWHSSLVNWNHSASVFPQKSQLSPTVELFKYHKSSSITDYLIFAISNLRHPHRKRLFSEGILPK